MRRNLPHRRPNVSVVTVWSGHEVAVTVGFDPTTGQPSEVFANISNGGDIDATMSDACVWASLMLQHGMTLDELAKSLGRVPAWVEVEGGMVLGEAPASPIGAALQAVRMVADGVTRDGFFGGEVR